MNSDEVYDQLSILKEEIEYLSNFREYMVCNRCVCLEKCDKSNVCLFDRIEMLSILSSNIYKFNEEVYFWLDKLIEEIFKELQIKRDPFSSLNSFDFIDEEPN